VHLDEEELGGRIHGEGREVDPDRVDSPQIDSRSQGFMERSLATVAHYRSMVSIQPRDSGEAQAYPA